MKPRLIRPQGRPRDENLEPTYSVSTRLTASQIEELKAVAKADGRTVSNYITHLLRSRGVVT